MGIFKKLFGARSEEPDADEFDDDLQDEDEDETGDDGLTDEERASAHAEFQQKLAAGELAKLEVFEREPQGIWGENVTSASVDASGGLVMVSTSSGARFFRADGLQRLSSFEFEGMRSGVLRPQGDLFAYGSLRKRVFLHRVQDHAELARSDKFKDDLDAVVWLGDGALAAIDQRGLLRIMSAESLQVLHEHQLGDEYPSVFGLCADPRGSVVFAAVNSSIVALSLSGQILWTRELDVSPGRMCVSADGSRLLTIPSFEAALLVLDASSGATLGSQPIQQKEGVTYPENGGSTTTWTQNLAGSVDGRWLAINTAPGNLQVFDLQTFSMVLAPERQEGAAWIESLCWTPRGQLVVGSSNGHVALWQVFPLQRLAFDNLGG